MRRKRFTRQPQSPIVKLESQAKTSKEKVGITPAKKSPKPLEVASGAFDDNTSDQWSDGFGRLATRAAQGLLVLTALTIIIYGMVTLSIVVIPILIATIIACAVQPFVNFLERRKIPRLFATIIALLTGAAGFSGIAALVILGVKNEWATLTAEVNNGIAQVTTFLASGSSPISKTQMKEITDAAMDFFTSSQFGSGALAGLGGAFSALAGLVLTIVILFFFVKDGPLIWRFLIAAFKPSMRVKLERVGEKSVKVLGGYISGTTIVALVDAILIGVALWILQVPLALPLALVVFVGAFIPIVGATLAGVIAALVALVTNDLNTAIIVVAVVVGVNQLEGNFLAPVVLGNALKIHALVILLALSIGTILGGIIGTLLSVPIAAVLWAAVKAWRDDSHQELKTPSLK